MDHSQKQLLKRAVRGDVDAFEELYSLNIGAIIYHTNSLLDDKNAVEDVVQEIAVKLFSGIRRLKSPEAFKSWLYRMIANTCYDYNVKHKAERYAADIDDYAESLADEHTDSAPEDALDQKDVNETVNAIIRSLPELQQRTLILYYYDDMSYRDIAQALNVTVSTVSTNLLRARKKMKEMLKSQNITSGHTGKHSRYGIGLTISQAISAEAGKITASMPVEHILHASHLKVEAAAAAAAKSATASTAASTVVAPVITSVVTKVVIATVSTVTVVGGGAAVVHTVKEAGAPPPVVSEEVGAAAYRPAAKVTFQGETGTAEHINPSSASLLWAQDTGTIIGWSITDMSGSELSSGKGASVSGVFSDLADGQYEIVWLLESAAGDTAEVARKFEIAPPPAPPAPPAAPPAEEETPPSAPPAPLAEEEAPPEAIPAPPATLPAEDETAPEATPAPPAQ
ncbi:MAG: sigma-70 family RNA polymerase sigma factor [Clostridiales Family XIII bacterium]|jgi:RNA polymerase sigma-70 factor (ECF subfamily)|nr:sigma-70 family RNA polymerase sigma factor [Clostridiales Family XIII bacterium]